MEPFERAVIVARQPGDAAQLDGLRPGEPAIGGSRKQQIAGSERELGPAYVQVAGMWPGGVGHHPWLVFKRNPGRGIVGDHRNGLALPRLATIERSPDVNAVPTCSWC